MKNLFIFISILFLSSNCIWAQAPSYTDFEWDIFGMGISIPVANDDLGTGLSFGGELRFNVADNYSFGAGSDISFFDLKNLENLEDDEDAIIKFSSTSYFSGDYYFSTTSANRGFVGLAVGHNDLGDIEITGGDEETTLIEGASGMSLSPRVGYELGHARFLMYYNVGLKEALKNQLVVKVSLTLWGGYNGDNLIE